MTKYGIPGLSSVLLVAAARADATPEQLQMLRDDIMPIISDQTVSFQESEKNAIRRTYEIMGADWQPSGEYETWLNRIKSD